MMGEPCRVTDEREDETGPGGVVGACRCWCGCAGGLLLPQSLHSHALVDEGVIYAMSCAEGMRQNARPKHSRVTNPQLALREWLGVGQCVAGGAC